MSCAEPSQLPVSRTVRELTSRTRVEFIKASTHELKGLPGRWKLFSVVAD